jgi:hypothetical protein
MALMAGGGGGGGVDSLQAVSRAAVSVNVRSLIMAVHSEWLKKEATRDG